MQDEHQSKMAKVYGFSDTPEGAEQEFIKNLQEGVSWASKTSEEWAKLKTYDLPKELIIFNLGVLAFVGALKDSYSIQWILVLAIILAMVSIMASFTTIRWVTDSNINGITKRRMIMQKALDSYLAGAPFKQLYDAYNVEMAHAQGELSVTSKLWKKLDNVPVVFFVLAMIAAVVGLLI